MNERISKSGVAAPIVVLAAFSVVVAAPTLLMGAWYLYHRFTGPPTFPGDPDIGLGMLLMVAMANAPFAMVTWIGWFAWAALSRRKME